jgi:hypothetical protein
MALCVIAASALSDLKAAVSSFEEDNAACSACNLIAKALDAGPLSSKLVQGWAGWSEAERSKALKSTMKRASCARISEMDIAVVSRPGVRTYFDMSDMRKHGIQVHFDDTKTGPEHGRAVRELCELLVSEKATTITHLMESWKLRERGRLVDFRFMTDAKLCAGGVLSVCKEVQERDGDGHTKQADADGDDDDDDDLERAARAHTSRGDIAGRTLPPRHMTHDQQVAQTSALRADVRVPIRFGHENGNDPLLSDQPEFEPSGNVATWGGD